MANEYFFIKKGALSPALSFAITINKTPVDLQGKTVSFDMRLAGSAVKTVTSGTTTLDGGSGGTGFYAWQAGDTDVPGEYLGTYTVNSGELILPEAGYVHVIVGDAV